MICGETVASSTVETLEIRASLEFLGGKVVRLIGGEDGGKKGVAKWGMQAPFSDTCSPHVATSRVRLFGGRLGGTYGGILGRTLKVRNAILALLDSASNVDIHGAWRNVPRMVRQTSSRTVGTRYSAVISHNISYWPIVQDSRYAVLT